MNKQDLRAIKNNEKPFLTSDTYMTEGMEAIVGYRIDGSDGTVMLSTEGQWFSPSDLKELRKLLKMIEAELA